VRPKVAWAAKSQFNQEQRPLLLPSLKPDNQAASLVHSKLAALIGSQDTKTKNSRQVPMTPD